MCFHDYFYVTQGKLAGGPVWLHWVFEFLFLNRSQDILCSLHSNRLSLSVFVFKQIIEKIVQDVNIK